MLALIRDKSFTLEIDDDVDFGALGVDTQKVTAVGTVYIAH